MGLILDPYRFAGAAFAPSDIASLQAWYKSDTGVTKDGSDLVSQWDDQSGNGLHLTEGTNQPLWVASQVNGYAAIRFDGANDKLINATNTAIGTTLHLFIVVLQDTHTNSDCIFQWDNDTASALTLQQQTSPGLRHRNSTALGTIDSNLALDTWGLVSVLWAASGAYIQVNNNSATTDADNLSGTSDGWCLGGGFSTNFADIDVAEICIFNAEITGTDLTNLQNYFNSRYALW